VVSDWGAVKDRTKAFDAGEDLEMPYSGDKHIASVMDAVGSGKLREEKIDECCKRLLALIDRLCGIDAPIPDLDAHHLLARREAEESAVLLKNDDNLLPIKEGQKLCVIGDLAKKHPVGGSSENLPLHSTIVIAGEQLKVNLPQWYFTPGKEPSED
jgi:beta-glucosidase